MAIAFIHNKRPGVTINKHTHEYIAKVTPPTCTERGYTTHTCKCGEAHISDYVDALGHNFGKEWLSDATGHWHTCSRCGAKDEVIAHLAGAEATTETPQTCVVCGYVIVPALHTHYYGDWEITLAATCTTAGQKRRSCPCGAVETEEIPALGHDLEYTVLKAPTCTTFGEEYFWCERCNYSATYPMPYAPHTEVEIPRLPVSCTQHGSTGGKKCSVCNAILEAPETIFQLGHYSDGSWKWTYNYHWNPCIRCDTHDMSYGVHIPVASANGYYCKDCGAAVSSTGVAYSENL